MGLARGIGIRCDSEKGADKDRSRFPEGMTERKARTKAEADPPPSAKARTDGHTTGVREFLRGGETWDEGASSMLVSPGINL